MKTTITINPATALLSGSNVTDELMIVEQQADKAVTNDSLMDKWHLRFTVTANCNYRCKYCNVHVPHSIDMSDKDLKEILLASVENGVKKVHWTGGEPLVMSNIINLMKYAKDVGFEEQYMTTNGFFLYNKAQYLKEVGINRINVSLDTLRKERFKAITGIDSLGLVLKGIDRMLEITDCELKTNSVIMKENIDEITDLINFAIAHNERYGKDRLISKFIQFSPSNPNQLNAEGQKFWTEQYIDSADIINKIKAIGDIKAIPRNQVKGSNPSTRYYTLDDNIKFGLLATFSWGYPCGSCHKLRITPQGYVTICSGDDSIFKVKDTSLEEKKNLIASALNRRHTIIENKVKRIHYRSKLGEFRFGATEKGIQVEEFQKILKESKNEDIRLKIRIQGNTKKGQAELNKTLCFYEYIKEIGTGLPILTPNGTIVKEELRKFLREEETKRGYHHVETPSIGLKSLYDTSQHSIKYANDMYPPFSVDGEEYVARSVTCPNHYMVFKNEPRIYKDLPLRLTEMSNLTRKDMTGELTGLFRANQFTLNDAHIFTLKTQVKYEFAGIIDFIKHFNKTLGIEEDITYRLSLSDGDFKNNKFIKNPEQWAEAEKYLADIMDKSGLGYYVQKNKACHYGPKLDVLMKKINGKPEIITTVQLDFVLPELFDVFFQNKDGKLERPVAIHRAMPFSMERTIGFLMEYYQGNLPFWLSPKQLEIIPLRNDEQLIKRASFINDIFRNKGIRSTLNDKDMSYNKKIKKAIQQRVNNIVLIGYKELENNMITIKNRSDEKRNMPLVNAVEYLVKQYTERSLD